MIGSSITRLRVSCFRLIIDSKRRRAERTKRFDYTVLSVNSFNARDSKGPRGWAGCLLKGCNHVSLNRAKEWPLSAHRIPRIRGTG